MIAHLRGKLLEKAPNEAIVDCGGVGYALTIPVSTYTSVGDTGSEASFHVYTAVREDAIQLFGFASKEEKAIFEKLIAVSGIGPKLAVTILSGIAVNDLAAAILGGDAARLVRIPGVGKKTAERIVLELKDKFQQWAGSVPEVARAAGFTTLQPVEEDVLSALLNLGCARPAAETALRKASEKAADGDFETLFRKALELLR
jgi:holliday junction DNA helicase RuvA